jgi:hypothetical protein
VKTLLDIKQDMSSLYDELKAGTVDIKIAGELANISGKYLKAEQLDLAREIFTRSINQPVLTQQLKELK